MGVVWGDGASSLRGHALGVSISDWMGHLIRTAWRRFFIHGGKL